jgi:hypothetical protein
MGKFEVKICYSGYVLKEIEAENQTEAYDKAIDEMEEKGLDEFTNVERKRFIKTMERWNQSDQINQIEED